MTVTEKSKTFLEHLKNRRSIRNYTAAPVVADDVEMLLEAGRYAPTALGKQSCHFIVVTDPQVLKSVADAIQARLEFALKWRFILKWFIRSLRDPRVLRLAERLREEDRNIIFYDAPCVIFCVADKKEEYGLADCLLAAENIMLQAEALQLGSVIVGTGLQANKISSAKQALQLPEGFTINAAVCIGHPEGEPPEAPPREENLIVHIDSGKS